MRCLFFFFNDTATTEIYTLSLHDALPIFNPQAAQWCAGAALKMPANVAARMNRCAVPDDRDAEGRQRLFAWHRHDGGRSEEHTSELQSRQYLVCRLLLEKKKTSHISTCTI